MSINSHAGTGTNIYIYIYNILKKSKTNFLSVFVIGLLAHLYKFANILPNHDALFSLYSSNNMIGSGRWFLAVASTPSSFFDLPWLTGIISLLWIALAAAIVTDYFDLHEKIPVIICSGLLVTFPSVVNTFVFEFTADAYFLSMLFAALTAHLSKIGKNNPINLLAASACICLSCGIYQAYVSFALLLSICHFMIELFRGMRKNSEYLRWICNQAFIYIVGLASYYIIWKLLINIQGVDSGRFTGVDSIMVVPYSIANLFCAFKSSLRTLAYFFLSSNVFVHGWSLYAVLNVAFLVIFAATLILVTIKTKIWKAPFRLSLLIICIVAIPIFSCICMFIAINHPYHLIMLQSLCILYIFELVLVINFLDLKFKNFACIFLVLFIFKFTVQANQVYFEMNLSIERSRATGIEMLTRIHMIDDGTIKKIALVGSTEQSITSLDNDIYKEIRVHGHQIRKNLLYDNTYGNLFLRQFLDSQYEPVSDYILQLISESEYVEQMSVWPLKDSVYKLDDIVIIKLSE